MYYFEYGSICITLNTDQYLKANSISNCLNNSLLLSYPISYLSLNPYNILHQLPLPLRSFIFAHKNYICQCLLHH